MGIAEPTERARICTSVMEMDRGDLRRRMAETVSALAMDDADAEVHGSLRGIAIKKSGDEVLPRGSLPSRIRPLERQPVREALAN